MIRVHGDYHLGQVLRVDDDYVILDFEGEPAKPLAKRREKQSPLKDVVGMLRSFDYAAHAGLFAATEGQRPAERDRLVPWARTWQSWTSARFLRAYLDTAGPASFLPRDRADLDRLLRAFTLDKAMYELLYELNNRPDWVRIPLRGVVSLIEQGRGGRGGGVLEEERVIMPSLLSDFDLYLLAEGTHHRSFEKLGAHLATHDGVPGTHFAVWAPNAESVSIIGDVNGWDPKSLPLERRGWSGIWERFVPHALQGTRYKYHIQPSGRRRGTRQGRPVRLRVGDAAGQCVAGLGPRRLRVAR